MQIVTLKKNTLIRHFIFLLILAIGFGTVWAATTIAGMVFGPGFRSAGRIILITTFSIIIAQIP